VHWLSSVRERANFISFMGGNKMATNKKPTHTLRCGNIKATIWQNVSEKGPFFATTFSRPFKDQSGAWRNGTSFVSMTLKLFSLLPMTPRSGFPFMP
jgi:hypothetical protein